MPGAAPWRSVHPEKSATATPRAPRQQYGWIVEPRAVPGQLVSCGEAAKSGLASHDYSHVTPAALSRDLGVTARAIRQRLREQGWHMVTYSRRHLTTELAKTGRTPFDRQLTGSEGRAPPGHPRHCSAPARHAGTRCARKFQWAPGNCRSAQERLSLRAPHPQSPLRTADEIR
jgi:hypothetical protein